MKSRRLMSSLPRILSSTSSLSSRLQQRRNYIQSYRLISNSSDALEKRSLSVKRIPTIVQSSLNFSVTWDQSGVKLFMPYEEFDVVVNDITEEDLVEIGRKNDIEHLSPGTFSCPEFPVLGTIHGRNLRFMVPLVCQQAPPLAGKQNSKVVIVWFLVDTSSPYTWLTEKTLEAFVGPGNVDPFLYRFLIQDQRYCVECQVSKGNFKYVNILGADAIKHLKLSIAVDWRRSKFKLVRL